MAKQMESTAVVTSIETESIKISYELQVKVNTTYGSGTLVFPIRIQGTVVPSVEQLMQIVRSSGGMGDYRGMMTAWGMDPSAMMGAGPMMMGGNM